MLPFFKSILTDAAYSDWLGKAVKATPSLARLTDADGRRAIDVAHSECRQAMNAALVAAEKAMEVEPKPSATAAVALALALAATAVALATATEPEPEPDLSVTSAPSTKDFDLFISHFTKDNSHTVQSGPLCIEASVHQRAQRGMPCIPPHTTMQVFQAVHSFMSAKDKVIFNPTTHLSHEEQINKEAMASAVRRSKLVLAALSEGFFASKW